MILTVTLNPSLDEWVTLRSLRLGQLNRSSGFARYPGGKGINVSRVVHELKGSTLALAIAGGDDGTILEGLLQRTKIPHQFISIAGSTRNNYKFRTRFPSQLTEVNTEGPYVSRTSLRMLQERLLQVRPAPSCVALSGSLPPGAPASLYRQWIRLLAQKGIPAVLDASGQALSQGVRSRPWMIKPNREEAAELLGKKLKNFSSVVRAAHSLHALGISVVVISLGSEGAVMAVGKPRQTWRAKPPSVRVDSAVGAGDSLVAGFLTGWSRTRSFAEALGLGVACGAATAMTPGTELCHYRDVLRVLRRVRIQKLD